MSFFYKKIVYLSYHNGDGSRGSAGFARVRQEEDRYLIELNLSGAGEREGRYPVHLEWNQGGQEEIGSLYVKQGRGCATLTCPAGGAGQQKQLKRICILFSGSSYAEGMIEEQRGGGEEAHSKGSAGEKSGDADIRAERRDPDPAAAGVSRAEDIFMAEESQKEASKAVEKRAEEKKDVENQTEASVMMAEITEHGKGGYSVAAQKERALEEWEQGMEWSGVAEQKERALEEWEQKKECSGVSQQKEKTSEGLEQRKESRWRFVSEKEETQAESTGGVPERDGTICPEGRDCRHRSFRGNEIILNDKWEQLCRIYTRLHPYEDERVYISIQPRDFVILTGNYQYLANNSFLLHGYYNYQYLILGREWQEQEHGTGQEADGEEDGYCFYLGVPGVYYEREKAVARMFGFEAFECAGGCPSTGTFGYYLKRVNI